MIPARLLAFLLHRANAEPPMVGRREFYALKDRLLERYAARDGEDVQKIEKPCWGDPYGDACEGPSCWKCRGTGVFETVYVRLERHRWGRYVFHRPRDVSWDPRILGEPTIHGYVQHARYGKSSAEAALWLYILTGEWALLFRSLRGTRRYGWWLWPLLNLQRLTFEAEIWRRARARRRRDREWRRRIHRPQSTELPF